MTTEVKLRALALEKIMTLHQELYWPCVDRWIMWRPTDYVAELRRIRAEHNPDASMRLRLPTLDDPSFFFWSVFNTMDEVFPDLKGNHKLSIRRLIGIRNAASHGDQMDQVSLDFVDRFAEDIKKILTFVIEEPPITPTQPTVVEKEQVDIPRQFTPMPVDNRTQVLACYIVCDKSASMAGEPIGVVNSSLVEMHRVLVGDPVVADKCRLGIISFSSRAVMELELSEPRDVSSVPVIHAEGITNYGNVFELLRQKITTDLPALSLTHRPLRPVVFFLTDGAPSDDTWRTQLNLLVDATDVYAPTIVVFPIGDVPQQVMDDFVDVPNGVTPKVQQLDPTKTLEIAVRDAIRTITSSIVNTVNHADDMLVMAN